MWNRSSLEPTQEMKDMASGTLPSEGLFTSPRVGPVADISLSYWRAVTTSGFSGEYSLTLALSKGS